MNFNIFLIGFMGAGKSTVAQQLENSLGLQRIEMDAAIVEQQGMSINDIFAKYGEPYFRGLETKFLVDLQQASNCVVSCGGGVPMREQNVKEMKKSGYVVLLRAKPETIFERVRYGTERPLLNGHMNVEYIRQLMEVRRPKYEAAADIVVDTDGKSAEEICREITDKVNLMIP
ncbi:MAG: shikimate kinase [Lachnospiraceae bacterium]